MSSNTNLQSRLQGAIKDIGTLTSEVKDLGRKTDKVDKRLKDVANRLDEKTGEVDEVKAHMQSKFIMTLYLLL